MLRQVGRGENSGTAAYRTPALARRRAAWLPAAQDVSFDSVRYLKVSDLRVLIEQE